MYVKAINMDGRYAAVILMPNKKRIMKNTFDPFHNSIIVNLINKLTL